MYEPFIYKLDIGNSDILEQNIKDNLIQSTNINLPLISLGFQNFLHRTKNGMNITKNLDTKNDFYYVVNPFEHIVSNYDDSLYNLSLIYFNVKNDIANITSRTFYKIWEILFLFDLTNDNIINCACISENTEPLIQAVINYRQKLEIGISNDTLYSVSIYPDKTENIEMSKQFLGFYNKSVLNIVNINNNIKKLQKITHIKNINTFKKNIDKSKEYANLVIADSNLIWDDEIYQEQEAYELILGEIIAIIKVQNKSGNSILKIFESFTIPTVKMIYLLSSFYKDVFIYKPYFSRPSCSEKYLICKDFIYDQNKDKIILEKKIKSLENILVNIDKNKYIYDIYPELNIPNEFINKIKFINIKFANIQQIIINEIIKYIKDNNYFGDKYHMYRDKQIEATKWWTTHFFPPITNLFQKMKNELHDNINTCLNKNNAEMQNFINNIVY